MVKNGVNIIIEGEKIEQKTTLPEILWNAEV